VRIGYTGGTMSKTPPKSPVIPFSPSEEDYLRQVAAAEPLAPISDRDPIALFTAWLGEATRSEPNDANAMTLATVDADGLPDARMVLLKGVDAAGFTFFTNIESAKGRELAAHPKAALVLHWKSLRRQVRVRGDIAPVTPAEADAYFATRARSSQIGAWASDQSRELPDRLALERRIAEMGLKFGFGAVPRPPHWSGYRLTPLAVEFWRDRPFRLHERLVFGRAPGGSGGGWTVKRLYP
jgi:pyridoxamine 5'-phosphate oxidase